MEALAKLFGSAAKLKLIRFFLFNHDIDISAQDLAARLKIAPKSLRADLKTLQAAGLVKKKEQTKAGALYRTNTQFAYFNALEAFIRGTTATSDKDMLALLKKTGTIRLIVLSGFFTNTSESSVDLLIVGDQINERALGKAVHTIEAELGREVRYAPFTTVDFRYRVGVYDRLIRDVVDYPHQILLDKIGL